MRALVCGISYDGGYQEFMVAPVEALARMPESLIVAEAAPLMCAGVTTFNALRHSGAVPSDLVAVQGIGGLGHLAIQFAKKFGIELRQWGGGLATPPSRSGSARITYIDSAATDAAAELQKLGGARAILTTAPSGNPKHTRSISSADCLSVEHAERITSCATKGSIRAVFITTEDLKSVPTISR